MTAAGGLPWRMTSSGILVRVRLTPKSSRDAVEGIEETAEGPALKARVRAVPSEGEANAAVERLLADWLGVPRRSVSLAAGGKSRIKSLAVEGEPATLDSRIAARLSWK